MICRILRMFRQASRRTGCNTQGLSLSGQRKSVLPLSVSLWSKVIPCCDYALFDISYHVLDPLMI